MIKPLLCYALLLVSSISYSQGNNFEKLLDSVQSETDAQNFIETNKSAKGKVLVFNKEKHHTKLANELFGLSVGSKKYNDNKAQPTYYKVLEKIETPYAKASCIYLDGKIKTIAEINKTRNYIINRYKNGYKFSDLARMHSMDKTAKQGGDLGWFTKGEMPANIENAVFSGTHDINDIFMVNIPEEKAYYVVLITEKQKLIEEIKVLKVTEPNR